MDGEPQGPELVRGKRLRGLLEGLEEMGVQSTLLIPSGSIFASRTSDSGWVIYRLEGREIGIAPPFPLTAEGTSPGFDNRPLLAQLESSALSAIVLVRLGRYAVGVFEGRKLVSSKTETRYVGNQHKAGGWSQKRFTRIREKQMRELYDKVCVVARDKIGPYEGRLERLWLGGDRHVLNGFKERCPWLVTLAPRTAERLLATPVPDLEGLRSSIDDAMRFLVVTSKRGDGG